MINTNDKPWIGRRKTFHGLTVEERFLEKTKKNYKTGCWEWRAGRNPKGYGNFWMYGKVGLAHRAAYTLFRGKIPDHSLVCHHCDNPRCVNPDHLFLGDHRDNANDMHSKGLGGPRHYLGDRSSSAKITRKIADEIRDKHKRGEGSYNTLAKEYELSRTHIWRILRGHVWVRNDEIAESRL